MLQALRTTIQNFLTIGNVPQSIDLSLDGLVLVLGENLDIGGANSRNGVGKTAVLQAISYGLFGKPLTKIRLDNLCNNINNKAMLVTIDFESNGKTYRIERGRKPSVLRFYTDGALHKDYDESQGETRHTQTEIDRVIGMSYVMFRHIVALNTSTTPFLREEVSVQREVIEELFGIAQLSQRAETLKTLIDSSKDRLRDAEATVKANAEANDRITQAITRATQDATTWQSEHDRKLADLARRAEQLHTIDIDYEIAVFDRIDQWQQQHRDIDTQRRHYDQQITSITQDIERFAKEIARYDAEADATDQRTIDRLTRQAQHYRAEIERDIQPQIDRLQAEVDRRHREADGKAADTARCDAELAAVQHQLDDRDRHTCATCGQGLAGTAHLATVIANLTAQQRQLVAARDQALLDRTRAMADAGVAETEIAHCQVAEQQRRLDAAAKVVALQNEIEQAIAEQQERRVWAEQQAAALRQSVAQAVTTRQQYDAQRAALPQLGARPVSGYCDRNAVWQVRQQRDLLVNQLESELQLANPIAVKIEGLQSTLIVLDYAVVNGLTVQLKHETFLLKLLTAKDSFIRKRIIDQNLKYLNKRLNYYLERIGLPHEVVFQPDLTVEIALLGRAFDFEQLSRGEMNRVILANAFAFRDVWENLNTGFNLMFVDECLDQGTDGAGVEAALDILAAMAGDRHKTIFLISHREELRDRIDQVMIVRKENHFTSFA